RFRWVAVLALGVLVTSACGTDGSDSSPNGHSGASTVGGDDTMAAGGSTNNGGMGGDNAAATGGTTNEGGNTSKAGAGGDNTAGTGGAGAVSVVVPYPLINLDINSSYTAAPSGSPGISMSVGDVAVNIQSNLNVSQTRFAMAGSQSVVITVPGGVTS